MCTWVSRYQNVSILDFIGAKGDGSGGNNWSYKTCKAPIITSPSTPILTGRMPLPVAQPTWTFNYFHCRMSIWYCIICWSLTRKYIYTTLFIIKINNITKSFSPGVHHFLYIDDFVVCYSSCNTNIIERKQLDAWLTSYNASLSSLSYSICSRGHYRPCWQMMERPWRLLPAIPELDVWLWRTTEWLVSVVWSVTRS